MDSAMTTETVVGGLTSDDMEWSKETVEYVRGLDPLAAGVLDRRVAAGAIISHADKGSCNLEMSRGGTQRGVRWTVCGEIGGEQFQLSILIWEHRTGRFGQWNLDSYHADPCAVMAALGGFTDEHGGKYIQELSR